MKTRSLVTLQLGSRASRRDPSAIPAVSPRRPPLPSANLPVTSSVEAPMPDTKRSEPEKREIVQS